MDTGLIFRIVGVGLLVSVACQILSITGREEQSMLVSVAGVVLIMLMLVSEISNLLQTIRALFDL
ncbi:MAG: stage III sporulation protein AC [Clostridia bacterium]|nr:stage III sporulation protein AC [Clostridia bacterium]